MALPVLGGPRVRLRPIGAPDLDTLYQWYNDAEVVAPFDRFAIDDFASFQHAVAAAGEDPGSQAPRFVVEVNGPPSRVVGMVGYYAAHPVLALTDVWYVLGDTAARGQGYGSEAVGLLVGFLFSSQELGRVGATCDVENIASARLVEKLGFRREGTLQAALFHHARWHDVAVFGITRAEWSARPPRS
ncbi:MAG: GNAT family N-acetyltransferase [Thermoplasmata archaeon]|nr:GNAT family N-acetyltransferase [Thermoplasmata archaeon]